MNVKELIEKLLQEDLNKTVKIFDTKECDWEVVTTVSTFDDQFGFFIGLGDS